MTKSWGLPSKRYFPREPREGLLDLICGLDAVYFYLNDETEFELPQSDDEEIIPGSTDIAALEISQDRIKNYSYERWQLLDEGQGGFAVMKSEKPRQGVRVGDLIAISSGQTDEDPSENWDLGIIRWLMVRKKRVYRIGVQKIPATVRPCRIRAVTGSGEDTRYRRALLFRDGGDNPTSVITSRGLFASSRKLELLADDGSLQCECDAIIESTIGFEQFSVEQH